jgi:hypothetical protein
MATGIAKHDLVALKRSIPRGGIAKIHEMMNAKLTEEGKDTLSYPMINAVMNGYTYRQDVIDMAIQYVKDLKRQVASNNKKIKSATQS